MRGATASVDVDVCVALCRPVRESTFHTPLLPARRQAVRLLRYERTWDFGLYDREKY